jgi:hypothetical protein
MKTIISASRRTDIPAFYSDWLLRRVREGACAYWHPFSRRWLQVSLDPRDVGGMVLWTKNLAPLWEGLRSIGRRYPFYVQYTITGHHRALEPRVVATDEALAQARALCREYGPDTLIWRFDPIVLTQHSDPEETLRRFERLSGELAGYARRCVLSFMSPYRRQRRAFEQAGLCHLEPTPARRSELAQRIGEMGRERGMAVEACCNPDIVGGLVRKARCIDADLLRSLGADLPARVPPAPSRKGCGCAKAVDIGAYDLCPAGCAYCYANQDHALACRNRARHDPGHAALAEAYLPPEGADAGPMDRPCPR